MQWFNGAKRGPINIEKHNGKKITHKNFWKGAAIISAPFTCAIVIVSTVFYAAWMDLGEWFSKFISSLYYRITPPIFIYLVNCETYTIIDFCGNLSHSLSNHIGFICMASGYTIRTTKEGQ
jgi:hypothetical protein